MASGWLKFLGTAGARFVVAKQLRASGGIWLSAGGTDIIIDPGPGSLVRCASSRPKLDPTSLDAVVLSHCHIDHSGDANAILDAMTAGGLERKGVLLAPRQCLQGDDAVVLGYLRRFLERVETLKAGSVHQVGSVRIEVALRHQHPVETYGLIIAAGPTRIGLVVDTGYFEALGRAYRGVELLIVNTVLLQHRADHRVEHLCLAEAEAIISQVRPRCAVLTHFGMTMLRAKPWELAEELSQRLETRVVAARDGMRLELEALA